MDGKETKGEEAEVGEEVMKGEEANQQVKEKDEVWLVNLGEDLEPVEVTRTKYLTQNPAKKCRRPIQMWLVGHVHDMEREENKGEWNLF